VKVDPNSHVPRYVQIADQLRAAIAAGVYRPGEALPSVRALAFELVVNPNTVQRAFDELEREGLVYSRWGAGVFVAAHGAESAQSRAEDAVREAFRQGIEAARAAHIEPDAIRALFDAAMEQAINKTRGKP
jgi:GntR family transcriptional regulator